MMIHPLPALHDGVALTRVAETLRQQAMHARNVASGLAGSDLTRQRDQFLSWVNAADTQLTSIFADPAPWQRLYSNHYWQIRDLGPHSPRPAELIGGEARRQAAELDRLAEHAVGLLEWINKGPAPIAVLDTNVLLHFLPPSQIKWPEILDVPRVRVVLPQRVIEELDAKKYNAKDKIADRARRLLSQLRANTSTDGRLALGNGSVLDVLVEDPRQRPTDADQEILDTCRRLGAADIEVTLVTDDAGLDLRARGRGVTVTRLPDDYRRKARSQTGS